MAELEPPSRVRLALRAASLLLLFVVSAFAGGLFLYGMVQVFSDSFTLMPSPPPPEGQPRPKQASRAHGWGPMGSHR
jgi:hypothetical protein